MVKYIGLTPNETSIVTQFYETYDCYLPDAIRIKSKLELKDYIGITCLLSLFIGFISLLVYII